MKMSLQRAILLVMCSCILPGMADAAEAHRSWINAGAQTETTRTASLDQNPEAGTGFCGLDQKYNVIGFNQNSNDLTSGLRARLDQIADDIGERKCYAQVVGYSSHEGSLASNALFAVERAQNALKYLEARGVSFARVTATGAGATNQFGPAPATNRRVVILVTP